MDLISEIREASTSPQALEQLYQTAIKAEETDAFQSALLACYEEIPENLLYAAWFHRLEQSGPAREQAGRKVNWALAIPLSFLTGLIFWWLFDFEGKIYHDIVPYIVMWWSPIATMSALVFLAVTAKKHIVRAVALGLGLLAVTAYALLLAPGLTYSWKIDHYMVIAVIHIPILCWIALGIAVLGFKSSVEDRFAFMIKSIEVMITAGLYLIAGVAFGGITVGMFEALNISLPDIWLRMIIGGGFGLLPVLAVASVYDPAVSPSEQDFDQGLSKFIATMMRLLLPLTLGVLVIYLFVIPFNFLEPFNNRDVLIVYNLMLFAIMGLLLGATPIREISPKLEKWLRNGIVAVAALTVVISLYALSATVYRTIEGGLTINRLTIIGWNSINITILVWLVVKQFKAGYEGWAYALQTVFSRAAGVYLVWVAFLMIALPLLFRGTRWLF